CKSPDRRQKVATIRPKSARIVSAPSTQLRRELCLAPFTGRKGPQIPRAHSPAHEAQAGKPHRRRHAPHLAVAALAKRDAQPRGGDRRTIAYRWVAHPYRGLVHALRLRGKGGSVTQGDTALQCTKS